MVFFVPLLLLKNLHLWCPDYVLTFAVQLFYDLTYSTHSAIHAVNYAMCLCFHLDYLLPVFLMALEA